MKMPEMALLDNDVIYKCACFDCVGELAQVIGDGVAPHRLSLADFVLRRKISKSSRIGDKTGAQSRLATCLAWAAALEPADEELALAADIEGAAQQLNVSFDSGESQLLAVLVMRQARGLYTGDKRALEGVGLLAEHLAMSESIVNKIVCFEQIMLILLRVLGAKELASRVCREAEVDKAASICCGCASGGSDEAGITEGLTSYINHLRDRCGPALSA
jgi:hypothetical protein